MSILLNTYSSLLTDISRLTGIHLDLPSTLDENWILIEGPQLDKAILASIESDGGNSPVLPKWLMPLWDKFIVSDDALVLRCLRILLVFGYKAEIEPTHEQLNKAQLAFESANLEVGNWNSAFIGKVLVSPLYREARRLVGRVIGRADWFDIIPSHGPGSVFPSHDPSEKSDFIVNTRINEFYPYDKYFNGLLSSGVVDLMSRDCIAEDKIHCKMVAVPKDSRGPRLISVHPKESIWIQQGQRRVLEQLITTNPLTTGRINFHDQTINGKLALESSATRDYVTIDLKEASDRIGRSLVDYLFGWSSKVLSCSRASHVKLLDSRLLELQMWAPMGNCLTFPVESLVFWSLVRSGILCRHGANCADIYVFGDDIIVPSRYIEGALYGLTSAGLIVNSGKTFIKGFFRESCGVDAYRGKDVTPLRCKVRDIVSYSDGESVCDLAKRLAAAGFPDSSACLYSAVSRKFGVLPKSNNPDCEGLVEYCDCDLWHLIWLQPTKVLWDCWRQHYCVPYRRLIPSTVNTRNRKLDSWWNLQDSLLRLERLALYVSSERGLEYLLPRREKLQRGYVEVYFK